jgi:hypothetical protein
MSENGVFEIERARENIENKRVKNEKSSAVHDI